MVLVETVMIKEPSCYEYDLTLNDGTLKLNCYTYEKFSPGDIFDDEISAWGIENIYKTDLHEFFTGCHELTSKQHINAKVINRVERVVQVGDYKIMIFEDVIPGDVVDGDFIEFDVERLTIY